jgi:hypothetical protein
MGQNRFFLSIETVNYGAMGQKWFFYGIETVN